MKEISRRELRHIFRSDTSTDISLFDERLEAINSAGLTLCEKFGGSFENVIALSQNSCQALIQIVIENFPSFDDKSTSRGEDVYIYKRAQILVADLWACFEGKGRGRFDDINEITMFADL